MKKGAYAVGILVLILSLTSLTNVVSIQDFTGFTTKEIPVETTNTEILTFFCPQDHCAEKLIHLINNAETIDCAFFELDHKDIINALENKNHRLVIDGNYKHELPDYFNAKFDTKNQFSHNKFCIFDNNIVWTGSMNPTFNGDQKNNNNALIIESSILANNYQKEFDQLWNQHFGKKKQEQDIHHKLILNNISIENYFCPQDNCSEQIIKELEKAQSSIHFMTFSFTHKEILPILLEKHQQGIIIKGIFEKRQKSKYANYQPLKDAGINVQWDSNPATMHHKVFIIDQKTTITGSMNPTKNGDTNNDENLLIIHNKAITKAFLTEFQKVLTN